MDQGKIQLEQPKSSKIIYRGRVVTLRLDEVELPHGEVVTREIIEHRGAVAIVPLLDEATVVMVRQFRLAANEYLLEVPAGTLERGEEPVVCAHRELNEEIGYRAGEMVPLFQQYLAPGYSSEVLHVFLARDLTKTQQATDPDESIEVVFTPVSEIKEMIMRGEIKDAKSIAGLLMALNVLGL